MSSSALSYIMVQRESPHQHTIIQDPGINRLPVSFTVIPYSWEDREKCYLHFQFLQGLEASFDHPWTSKYNFIGAYTKKHVSG